MKMTGVTLIVGTVLAFGLVSPGRASADSLVPFGGTISEHFTVSLCTGCRIATITGTGELSHLGATSEASTVIVNTTQLLPDGCQPETRTTTLTAANGDALYLDAVGETCPNNTSTDQWQIVDGTGRFLGASGSGTDTGRRTFLSLTPPSGVATITYSGRISSIGSLHHS